MAIYLPISGSWYNPNRDGEGFFLEVLANNRLIVYWFTCDLSGNPMWLVGVGNIENHRATVPVQVTRGGNFGLNFNPASIERTPWGTLTLSFSTCHEGTVSYQSVIDGFGSGTLDITRLTSLAGLACR